MISGETTRGGAPAAPLAFLSRRALRFWKSALLVGGVACAAGVLIARRSDQPYKSETVLTVDQGMPKEAGVADPMQAGGRLRDQLFAGERLNQVVQDFNLHPDVPRQRALEEVKKNILFNVQPGGTFSISFIGTSPQQAQAVTKRLAETLLVDHNAQRSMAARDTNQFLDSEQRQLEEEVRRREVTLKQFLAIHPEATTAEQPDQPMLEDPGVMMLEQELARMHGQARPAAATGGALARSSSEVLELRQQVEAERAKAERDLRDKLDTLTEAHPDVIVARERVKRAQADAARFAGAADGKATTAAAVEDPELKRSIQDLESRIGRMRSAARRGNRRDPVTLQLAVQLQRLRGDLGESRERLSRLEDQQLQARVVEKMATTGNLLRLRVLDPATLPGSPMQSRRRRIALAGFAVAFLLAAGTAFGRAALSDRIYDRDDILQFTGVSVLTVVPRLARGGSHV
jgi:uncharacterized protein involved in exopolysaccharide biosynthesis